MRGHRLIAAAWAIHLAAWVLPVHKEGVTLPKGVPGWQAFRVAFSPVWPYEDFHPEPWWAAALWTLSALTNLVMVLSLWIARRPSSLTIRVLTWAGLAAFIINAYWLVADPDSGADLRVGYFLWWVSFAILTAGLLMVDQARRRAGGAA